MSACNFLSCVTHTGLFNSICATYRRCLGCALGFSNGANEFGTAELERKQLLSTRQEGTQIWDLCLQHYVPNVLGNVAIIAVAGILMYYSN